MDVNNGPCIDRQHIKQPAQFHLRLLIMSIHWQDKVTNQEVLDKASSASAESLWLKISTALCSWWRWAQRRPAYTGQPKMRYKDILKRNFRQCSFQPHHLDSTMDRPSSRSLTYPDLQIPLRRKDRFWLCLIYKSDRETQGLGSSNCT